MWEIFKKGGSRILDLTYTVLIYFLAIPHYVWMFFTEADIRKMNKLTENLLDDICRQAGKDIGLLDTTEIIVLATYLVSEFYYQFAQDEKKASKLLDRYFAICAKKAERTLNGTPTTSSTFETKFINKTSERYLEYRDILYKEHKLSDNLFSSGRELTKHFFVPSPNLDDLTRNSLTDKLGSTIALNIELCLNTFMH